MVRWDRKGLWSKDLGQRKVPRRYIVKEEVQKESVILVMQLCILSVLPSQPQPTLKTKEIDILLYRWWIKTWTSIRFTHTIWDHLLNAKVWLNFKHWFTFILQIIWTDCFFLFRPSAWCAGVTSGQWVGADLQGPGEGGWNKGHHNNRELKHQRRKDFPACNTS